MKEEESFFLLFIAYTECVTILDGFPTIRASFSSCCLFSLKAEEKKDCAHVYDEMLESEEQTKNVLLIFMKPLFGSTFSTNPHDTSLWYSSAESLSVFFLHRNCAN